MSTNRITSNTTLIETLRSIAQGRSTSIQHRGDVRSDISVASRHDVTALRKRLRDIVASMGTGDAESVINARNATVREILLWEFGSEFRHDSQFLPMVDAISKAFDIDPALQRQFTELAEGLRKA